jgi:hypothetical protein
VKYINAISPTFRSLSSSSCRKILKAGVQPNDGFGRLKNVCREPCGSCVPETKSEVENVVVAVHFTGDILLDTFDNGLRIEVTHQRCKLTASSHCMVLEIGRAFNDDENVLGLVCGGKGTCDEKSGNESACGGRV